MKQLIMISLILFTTPVHAGNWKGKSVLVSKSALICDYFHIEKALILLSAGDTDSIRAWLKKGYCVVAPKPVYVTVTDDTSSFSDLPLIEVVLDGADRWMSKHLAKCCYTKTGDRWTFIDTAKIADERLKQSWKDIDAANQKKKEECEVVWQRIREMKNAGLFGTEEWNREAEAAESCKGGR